MQGRLQRLRFRSEVATEPRLRCQAAPSPACDASGHQARRACRCLHSPGAGWYRSRPRGAHPAKERGPLRSPGNPARSGRLLPRLARGQDRRPDSSGFRDESLAWFAWSPKFASQPPFAHSLAARAASRLKPGHCAMSWPVWMPLTPASTPVSLMMQATCVSSSTFLLPMTMSVSCRASILRFPLARPCRSFLPSPAVADGSSRRHNER